jgi:hypothetical protein
MRDGFIFYESFREAMRGLPAETQLTLYNAIADYGLYDEQPDFGGDGVARGFFALVRPQIDANNRRRENGLRGGRPVKAEALESTENQTRTEPEPSENQTGTKLEPKEKEKAKAKEHVNCNAKEKGNANAFRADKPRFFTKPTVEEIYAYCRERGNAVDARRFFDHYEAVGWRIGNQPMRDWQASVRTWEGRDEAKAREPASTNPFKRMLQEEEIKRGQTGNNADSGNSTGRVPELLQGDGG